jgi:ATP-dependent RNA helicase DeaD
MKKIKFDELSLSNEMQEAIGEMGFVEASHIQSEAIPHILEGKDVIGQAQTGTGKTAAFGIPLLETIDPKEKGVSAVILCPTRELAIQVANELKKLAKFKKGLHVLPIYGGEAIDRQIRALKRGISVVVGTPGRVIDHLERKTLSFDSVKMVVLDEADEMLNMGFREDIETILSDMPEERQTVLFSATMPKPILNLVHKYQKNPKMVKVTNNEITASSVEQVYYEVSNSMKVRVLSQLIQLNKLQLMLTFCNTKRKVDEVVKNLRTLGHKAEGIHGDLSQAQRNNVLGRFRKQEVNILVATDVAARGIDVSDVDAVFNYDIPLDPEYYVHRIGRTGRAGKTGIAISFVTGRTEMRIVREIMAYTKVKINPKNLPTGKEMADLKKQELMDRLKAIVAKDGLDKFEGALEYFRKEFTLHELTLALLKLSLVTEEPKLEDSEEEGRGGRRDRDRDSGGREDREDRRDRRRNGRSREGKDTVRLFINLGRKDRVSPKDIAGALVAKSGLSFKQVGDIDIYDSYSFVEVPNGDAERVIEMVNNDKIKGKKVSVEMAKV